MDENKLQAFYDDFFGSEDFKNTLKRLSHEVVFVHIYGHHPTKDELDQYIGQMPEWLKGLAC